MDEADMMDKLPEPMDRHWVVLDTQMDNLVQAQHMEALEHTNDTVLYANII